MQNHIVLKPISEVYGTTISNTVTSLPSIPTNALKALICVETADIRVRYNATNSVTGGTSGGILFQSGERFEIEGWDNLNRLRMFRDATTSAFIQVVYFGEGQP